MANYVRLKWYNSCDLGRIYYQSGFYNLVYFETYIIKPEFKEEEEGFVNSDGVFIKTSETLNKQYKFEVIAPEYVVNAMKAMKLHDTIQLAYLASDGSILYQTAIRNVQVNISWEETFADCMANIEVLFEQDDNIVTNNCCNNLT